jgi:hypothetical protein
MVFSVPAYEMEGGTLFGGGWAKGGRTRKIAAGIRLGGRGKGGAATRKDE